MAAITERAGRITVVQILMGAVLMVHTASTIVEEAVVIPVQPDTGAGIAVVEGPPGVPGVAHVIAGVQVTGQEGVDLVNKLKQDNGKFFRYRCSGYY